MSVPKQYLDPEIECASTDEMRQPQDRTFKTHGQNMPYEENVPLYQERMNAIGVYLPDDIITLLTTCINFHLQ